MWTVVIIITVIAIAAALTYYLPDPTQGELSRNKQPERHDLIDQEESNECRKWAATILNNDKQLTEWEITFLTKIKKSNHNLTERQGDKVHDMYANYLG